MRGRHASKGQRRAHGKRATHSSRMWAKPGRSSGSAVQHAAASRGKAARRAGREAGAQASWLRTVFRIVSLRAREGVRVRDGVMGRARWPPGLRRAHMRQWHKAPCGGARRRWRGRDAAAAPAACARPAPRAAPREPVVGARARVELVHEHAKRVHVHRGRELGAGDKGLLGLVMGLGFVCLWSTRGGRACGRECMLCAKPQSPKACSPARGASRCRCRSCVCVVDQGGGRQSAQRRKQPRAARAVQRPAGSPHQ